MKINKYAVLLKNITITVLTIILCFSILEIGCRVLALGVNTGMGLLEETALVKFKIVNKKDEIDRDIFIETGPKVYPIPYYNRSKFNDIVNRRQNEYTIVTIGDSCTYGLGVSENETFSYYLEESLNDHNFGKRFRVFNFGWPGYASSQGVVFLEKYIKDIRPNMVVAWFGANDGCYAPFFSDKEFYDRKNYKLVKLHNFLYRRLKFYRILRNINLFSKVSR